MSWFSNILPGVKSKGAPRGERGVPEGVWEKCKQCTATIYSPEKEKNHWVCPHCGHHDRITAAQRAQILLDPDPPPQEIAAEARPTDLLKFSDGGVSYVEQLTKAQDGDSRNESVRVWRGNVSGAPVVAVIFDFNFLGGSMGGVAGERFVRAADAAAKDGAALLTFAASGGARMQEGMSSLLQMAKTTSALKSLSRLRLPHVSILTDPTTGGVAASFAMLGDIVIAEPKALIGFAGPRVIQQTVREELPEGFQRSEFLLARGAIDMIVDRRQMRDNLGRLLALLRRS